MLRRTILKAAMGSLLGLIWKPKADEFRPRITGVDRAAPGTDRSETVVYVSVWKCRSETTLNMPSVPAVSEWFETSETIGDTMAWFSRHTRMFNFRWERHLIPKWMYDQWGKDGWELKADGNEIYVQKSI